MPASPRTRSVQSVVAAACLIVATSAIATEPRYALDHTGTKSITATFTFAINSPTTTVDKWLIYMPQAPALHQQGAVSTWVSPTAAAYTDLSPRHHPLVRVELPATTLGLKHRLKVHVVYRATLYGRALIEREHDRGYLKPSVISAEEREHSLAVTPQIDFTDPKFRQWIVDNRLQKGTSEDALSYGRRVYRHLVRTMKYEYKETMDRHASYVCRVGHTDCGGMSVALVACLRTYGIPARVLAGRWAKSSKPHAMLGDVAYHQQHVKAEFYVDEVGWVPADVSSAVLYDRKHDGMSYFGRDDADFLVLHVDPDIEVASLKSSRETFPWIQGFHYYVLSSSGLRDATLDETWTVVAR